MLDPKFVKKEYETVLKMLRDRNFQGSQADALKILIQQRGQLISRIDADKHTVNNLANMVSEAKKQDDKEKMTSLIQQVKTAKKLVKANERSYLVLLIQYLMKIGKIDQYMNDIHEESKDDDLLLEYNKNDPIAFNEFLEKKYISSDSDYAGIPFKTEEKIFEDQLGILPNLIDKSVPIGDATKNQIISKSKIAIPEFDFHAKNHIDLSESLGLIDLERAAKVSGSRFYFLRNDLVKLNHSLIQFSLDFLQKREYKLVQPPYMINHESMAGATIANDFEEVIYKIEDEDLYMIGTSEHAMAAMHSNEIIDGKELPLRYAGVSPCFRKEAGAHGKDQKGIFRVHQFEKIEQFVYADPEYSKEEHEKMLKNAEDFYDELEIPYQVVLLSSQDMGSVSAKTYDIEAWMAGQNSYREIVSCSNCLDYQARRLKIRFRDKTNEDTQYLHTLNSTLVATTRVLVSIMENFQTKDGHIKIPHVLQSYMGNQKEI